MKTCREDEGVYALVPDDRELRPSRKVTSPPPLDYRVQDTQAPQANDPFPDKPIDLQLPLVLLAGGVLVHVVAAFINARDATAAIGRMSVGLIIWPAVMMIGVLIAARFRQIDFGHFGVAAMKLAAICVAPPAAVIVLMPIARMIPIFGWLALLIVEFVLYFALIGTMFKLDESDTSYCVGVFFVLDVAMYFALRAGGVTF